MNAALRQAGQTVDYLYATDATRAGMWLGSWGLLRTYGSQRGDLVPLPDNDISKNIQFTNQRDFDGVCPKSAPVKSFDVTAVLANEVLPNNLGVVIPSNAGQDSDGDGIGDNAGGRLDPNGGTLVYNRRQTNVPEVVIAEPGLPPQVFAGGDGPINDPTAMMYVRTDDLMGRAEAWAMEYDPVDCFNQKGKNKGKFNPGLAGCDVAPEDLEGCGGSSYNAKLNTCPIVIRPDAPVEPLVLRANAGDCIEVTLRNKLVNEQAVVTATGEKVFYAGGSPVFADLGKGLDWYTASGALITDRATVTLDLPPDLAGWQDMYWGVTRRIQGAGVNAEMYFFNNNLVRPGSYAGIHPQLVEYDASRDDGVAVGRNQPQVAAPGGTATARYYAGHLEYLSLIHISEPTRLQV